MQTARVKLEKRVSVLERKLREVQSELARQIAQYGSVIQGMPPPWVYRGADGALMIYDGVTRATRVTTLLPGRLIQVEVVGDLPAACSHLPSIGDYVP